MKSIYSLIVHLCARLDELTHSFGFAFDPICEIADMSYGWGPDAVDWTRARRFTKFLYERTR